MNTISKAMETRIRSEMLGTLRKIAWIKPMLGQIAQFTIVLDANIILGDLIWLVSKRKKPDSQTELMECIRAGTVVAYIARTVYEEVNEHIPAIAVNQGISEDALRKEWKAYRKLIKIRAPRKALVDRHRGGQDPDDAPTLALAEMIDAAGILSKDTDIVAMGGLVIELDFTKQARDYSRKAAVRVTICYAGGITLIASWKAIEFAIQVVKGALAWFRELPRPIQMLIFAAIVVIALNKNAQKVVADMIRKVPEIKDGLPVVLALLGQVGTTLAENTVPPPVPRHAKKPDARSPITQA